MGIKKLSKKVINKVFYQQIKNTELARYHSLISANIARGTAGMQIRKYIPEKPTTWEFSGFSQNGEDGIINELINQLKICSKYFVEIGSSNGIENNTAWLAHVRRFKGLMIDADISECNINNSIKPWLVDVLNTKVYPDDSTLFSEKLLNLEPDLFSLDIDSFDYYIAQGLFSKNFKPKVVVVEYNSAFGPEKSLTIKYNGVYNPAHYLYYGVSVAAWKKFFSSFGYSFVTVDSNGVNAFFVRNDLFDAAWLSSLKGLSFEENAHQLRMYKCGWEEQFNNIKEFDFLEI